MQLSKYKNLENTLMMRDNQIDNMSNQNAHLNEQVMELQQKLAGALQYNQNNKEIYEAKIVILEKNIKDYSDVTHELMSLHQRKIDVQDMRIEGIKATTLESIRNIELRGQNDRSDKEQYEDPKSELNFIKQSTKNSQINVDLNLNSDRRTHSKDIMPKTSSKKTRTISGTKHQTFEELQGDTELDRIDPHNHNNFKKLSPNEQSIKLRIGDTANKVAIEISRQHGRGGYNNDFNQDRDDDRRRSTTPKQGTQSHIIINNITRASADQQYQPRRHSSDALMLEELNESVLKEKMKEAMPNFAAMRLKNEQQNTHRQKSPSYGTQQSEKEYIDKLKDQLLSKHKHIRNLESKIHNMDGSQIMDGPLNQESEFKFQSYPHDHKQQRHRNKTEDYEDHDQYHDHMPVYNQNKGQYGNKNPGGKTKPSNSGQNVKVKTYYEPAESMRYDDDNEIEQKSRYDYNRSQLNQVVDRFGNLQFDVSHTSYNY